MVFTKFDHIEGGWCFFLKLAQNLPPSTAWYYNVTLTLVASLWRIEYSEIRRHGSGASSDN